MAIAERIVSASVTHYKSVTGVMVAAALLIALAAGLPALFPDALSFLHVIDVDTDPENMLSADEPVRVFHNRMKERLDLHDMVVVGVVNRTHPQGVFNAATLKNVYDLTQYVMGPEFQWSEDGRTVGVILKDVIAPSTVDDIHPGKVDPAQPELPAPVEFSWLMPQPPKTDAQALRIWQNAQRIPFLDGTLVSDADVVRPIPALEDQLPQLKEKVSEEQYARLRRVAHGTPSRAVALYIPLTRKDLSYRVYAKLRDRIAALAGDERYYITGLPVAEDTFGVEMFIQMAISAPAAMVVIFLLMLAFFRKLVVILSPMIVALVSVIFTMGALIIAGYPIHIMSSMIPIFIMPIAVLDSIHIISDFFEKYQATRDREQTARTVMHHLFLPMLYTSLTSAAGFASLALTPIPPVQVFGVFVALGIMVAWMLTVTFIPAFVMFIPPRTLANFGAKHAAGGQAEQPASPLGRFLRWMGGATSRRAKPILAVALVVLIAAGYGISRININDNPVKWFTPSHPIRVADDVLNEQFGGTYMAYLALRPKHAEWDPRAAAPELAQAARERAQKLQAENLAAARDDQARRQAETQNHAIAAAFKRMVRLADEQAARAESRAAFLSALADRVRQARRGAEGEPPPAAPPGAQPALPRGLDTGGGEAPALPGGLDEGASPALPAGLDEQPATKPATQPDQGQADQRAAWRAVALFLSERSQEAEIFKHPDTLRFISDLQATMADTGVVGKSNSLADIVKTVNREFVSGRQRDYRIPGTPQAVGQLLVQYQSSHRKDDLWHFVTRDHRSAASIWVQLKSGDNQDMTKVTRAVGRFVEATRREQKDNPSHPVHKLTHDWFGLTYINVIWQEKMVTGMLKAFAGSFLVVFLLMTILFRSALWGLLSMIPLTVTIAAIYGAVGLVGKDYDMPVAVLSSLTLGLAVDFAIHFLARSRAMYARHGTWRATAPAVFGEPARAIARNIIVIAAGFLPLLLAPLVPYKTVGILLATILLVSGVGTLLLLPALMAVLEKKLFAKKKVMGAACNCVTCAVTSVTLAVLVAMTLNQSLAVGWGALTWVALAAVPIMALTCGLLSRRQRCRIAAAEDEEKSDE